MRNLQITNTITNRETAAVELYFNDIAKMDMASPQEEVELAQKIRLGDQVALDKLIHANLRFVVSVAKKYQYQGLPLNDLINEGNLGLVKAARRFDETRGFKFISFAVWWIRQSILSAIAEHTRMVRLPMNQINLLTKMNRLSGELESHLERKPTNEELAELMEVPIRKIEDAHYFSARTSSYDAPFCIEDQYALIDTLPAQGQSVESILINESCQQNISCLLNNLTPCERQVIELSFGLHGDWPLLPTDIGKVMNLTAERVRQIKNDAVKKLKDKTVEIKTRLL
ncbi:RNA polymerase sigma factor RpoD/SigA [Mucilaginibacter sp. AW1-7]|jgi:RNA polymerase primary sigma factor|uniref:sigma-70 family RNA polymerase sigma factor n=1 Tax=Mucilaginibacter sp. AW1-7 TaxID=3349874 RepID=UPI003F73FC66